MKNSRKIILEDGSEFAGLSFGAQRDVICEIVFKTSMAGYQEILSDPSYTGQAVVMSYPLIGSYGITDEDFESRVIAPSALIVRGINESPSNFRSVRTVGELLEENGAAGLYGVDTRALVRKIRDVGTVKALITGTDVPAREGAALLAGTELARDAVKRRSCMKKWYSRTSNPRFHVVAIDCGMKTNILRMLNRNRCNVTIVPYDTGSGEILSLAPDGVLISNGPGDPQDVPETVRTLRELKGKVPMFGICLGHQLLALAHGAGTYKLKFGHRGGNHPVKDLVTGRIEITSQNHSYAVDRESLSGTGLAVSHINLLDGTVEGLVNDRDGIFSVQYHPESAPGPCDSHHLFRTFTERMERERARRKQDAETYGY